MNKEPFPGYNDLRKEFLVTDDYYELPDGSIQIKGLKSYPGKSGIRCPNMNCQHDLYIDGNPVCGHCLELETETNRICHLCGYVMRIL